MTPLRILMFTTFYPPYSFGGDAVGVQRMARALVERGHQVAVVHDEDAYLTLLRRYVEQYRFREATPEDFMALAEEIGGPQVRELYDKWIEHDDEGRPAVAPQPTPTPAPE